MKALPIVTKAKVWIWKGNTGPASWHFITIPIDESDMIKEMYI